MNGSTFPEHPQRRGHKPKFTAEELAKAFAIVIARPGTRASIIDADNEKVGEALVFDAVQAGRPYYVEVSLEIVAVDVDIADGEDATAAHKRVKTWVRELKAEGEHPVLVASGGRGRMHGFVRIADAERRKVAVVRAKALGFDVRQTIRPPLSPHRRGGHSQLLEPSDPLEALVSLASARRPPGKLRGRIRETAFLGTEDRSRAAASTVMSLVQREHSDEGIYRFLMDRRHASGEKLRAIDDAAKRRRAVRRLCISARRKVSQSPPRFTRPDVDVVIDGFIRGLEVARSQGRLSAELHIAGRMIAEIARQAGTVQPGPGCRRLAEDLGVSAHTAARYCRELCKILGNFHLEREGKGKWTHVWRIGTHSQSSLGTHLSTPSGGAVGEVGRLPNGRGGQCPKVGEVRLNGDGGSGRSSALGEVRTSANGRGGESAVLGEMGLWLSADAEHEHSVSRNTEGASKAQDSLSGAATAQQDAVAARCGTACLVDPAAADVFGPRGWFGTRGLGFLGWEALLWVEERGYMTAAELTARLGVPAADVCKLLTDHELLTDANGFYSRGPARLEDVARKLRTLGSRAWQRAKHAEERRRYRDRLERACRDPSPALERSSPKSLRPDNG